MQLEGDEDKWEFMEDWRKSHEKYTLHCGIGERLIEDTIERIWINPEEILKNLLEI
jgi:hypothetical protein